MSIMSLFKKPSLMTRIAIGKLVGFMIGLLGVIVLPFFIVVDTMFLWGILFWYTTLGAVIGVFGVFNYHPILKLPLPWWFRSSWIGAWMNFVLMLFIYEQLQSIMQQAPELFLGLTSPYWFVLEGALVGLLIGYLTTRFAGEGKETVETNPENG